MKKIFFRLMIYLSVILMFSACNKENDQVVPNQAKSSDVSLTTSSNDVVDSTRVWFEVRNGNEVNHLQYMGEIGNYEEWDWTSFRSNVFQFKYQGIFVKSDYEVSVSSIDTNGFTMEVADYGEILFTNIQTVDSITSANVIFKDDTAEIKFLVVDDFDLYAFAMEFNVDSKRGPRPGIKLPGWLGKVFDFVAFVWDQLDDCSKKMMKEASKCELHGCTPLFDFNNCKICCMQHIGTPAEKTCDGYYD